MQSTLNGYKHEASGAVLHKELAQPHVDSFKDIFTDWAPWDFTTQKAKHAPRFITGQAIADNMYRSAVAIMKGGKRRKRYPDQSMQVGPFCSRRNGSSFSVSCADWVLSRIRERTIIIGGDRMSFEIVDHNNGWSLVVAQHGQICGSVWLAYIRTETIPAS